MKTKRFILNVFVGIVEMNVNTMKCMINRLKQQNATNGCQIEKFAWWSATVQNDILELSGRQNQLRRKENDSS